uniref:Uncharacterized protein n=1 Tax=Streptococcus suis TaxID=1307 RepID=A0A1X9I1M9_STRSU|nr:hypothetical protein [Streptococcus suis]
MDLTFIMAGQIVNLLLDHKIATNECIRKFEILRIEYSTI